jgi:hypothetical protein
MTDARVTATHARVLHAARCVVQGCFYLKDSTICLYCGQPQVAGRPEDVIVETALTWQHDPARRRRGPGKLKPA